MGAAHEAAAAVRPQSARETAADRMRSVWVYAACAAVPASLEFADDANTAAREAAEVADGILRGYVERFGGRMPQGGL